MKRQLKRWVSLILVCLMLVSSIPFNVLAEEQQAAEPVPKETVEATEFSGATPSGDNPNDAAAQVVQPVITEPKAEVIDNQSVPAQENLTTTKNEELTVLETLVVTLKADKTPPQNRNTTVLFTATATGGDAPYSYQFSVDGVDRDVPVANTDSILLIEAGKPSIKVVVTDANGDTAETTLMYEIKDNPLATLTTDPADAANHYVKDEVTLSAVVEGGTAPFICRFYYQLGSQKVEIKNPIVNDRLAEVSFIPATAGTYTLMVEVTDGKNLKTTATKTGFTVLAPVLAKSFTADKPSGQNVGTTIKLTANGSGGKVPYTYEFEYLLDNSITPVPIDEEKIPGTNTVQFTPDTPGTYTFRVFIKDNDGLGNEIIKTIDNYRIVNGPVIENFTAENESDPEEPTYIKNPILLKVDLAEGTGTDTVKYTYTIKNGSKTIKTITQAEDSYRFTPDSPGTYNFTVKAVDSDNLSATKSTSLVVLNTVSVTLKADKPSGQSIHTDINLTATATGGQAPYTYEFKYVYKGSPKVLQYASQSKTATFTIDDPEKTGSYTLQVEVTDANGTPAVPVSAELTGYQIKNPPVIDSFTAVPVKGSNVYAGTPITLAAKVMEGTGEKNPLDYQFYVNGDLLTTDTEGADLTQITSGICKYTPSEGRNYTFEVAVSDGVTTVKQKITNYKVIGGVEVTSLKPDKPTGLIVGDTIKLTAAGMNGVAPYTYAFYYDFNDGNGITTTETPIAATDAKSKTATSEKFLIPGDYTFYVVITDKNGEFSINEMEKAIKVTVTDPPIVDSLKVTDPVTKKELTSSYAGKAITLTATSADNNLTYTFSYKVGSKTTTIAEKDADGTVEFPLPAAGSYTFYVSATDANGLPGPAFAVQKFTVLKDFAVKSLKTSKPSGQNINTEIKLTATAEGGKAPYKYSFYQKLKTLETDTITEAEYADCKIIEGSSLNNASYTPAKEGTYIFMVVISDANDPNGPKVISSIDFEVANPPIVTFADPAPASQKAYQGDTVTLKANVATGTGVGKLDYRFYWKMGTETGEIASFTGVGERTQTASFKPADPGTYTLFVDVIDEDGTLKTAKIASYKVLGTLTVDSLVVDQPAPQNIGTTIKLTANCSGGKTPYKYQFYYQFDALAADGVDVKVWTAIGTKTTSKSLNYRLTKAGTYKFGVQLIDGNNTNIDATEPDPNSVYEDYVVADKPIITSFTASPSLKWYVEEPITLSAAARGGSGTYTYKFYYVDSLGTETPIADDDNNSPNTVKFSKIETPGTYKFRVTVTDTTNTENTAEKTINYTLVSKPSIKTFSLDKTEITPGSSVKLTAAGTGGIGTYQYKFLYATAEDGTGEQMIRSFSGTPSFTYRIPAATPAGTYFFYVDIKDSKSPTTPTLGKDDKTKMVKVTVTE